ncbi:MAG: hypothetical protein L0323_06170 [Planctomycetes bacterium]|nr:hypothetical protein [Planctomycetota bacterium]
MSILHTLEDFDSRLDKVRTNLVRWFVLAAVVAFAAVVVSWSVRRFITQKSESKWVPFDAQLNVGGGFLGFPTVMAKHDPDVAATEIRAATGQCWGEVARAVQAGRMGEIDRLSDSISSLKSALTSDPGAKTLSALAPPGGSGGFENLAGRAESLRSWLSSHGSLTANPPKDGAPGFELELEGGRLAFRFDPQLPSTLTDGLLAFVKGGGLTNATLAWSPGDRCYDLKPAADRAEAPKDLNSLLEAVRPDQASYSLFRGTLASRPLAPKDGGTQGTRGLALLGYDTLGREFDWIPLATITEGGDLLPATSSPGPERTEIKIVSAK